MTTKMKLKPIPESQWPHKPDNLIAVYLNNDFLAQIYQEVESIRLSVNRTKRNKLGWHENISWDELMEIKDAVGLGDDCAIEIYPPNEHVVNVANMRHLWIVSMPSFAWRKKEVLT